MEIHTDNIQQQDNDFRKAQDAKYLKMTTGSIPALITKMAIPTICTMLITTIYNMADTYFVSQIGTSASAAVGVLFSLMAIIQAFGFTFGVGAATIIARLLGEKKREEACQTFAVSFFTSIVCGFVVMIFGLMFLEPLIYLLGATSTVAPYAIDYAKYILIASPYMIANFVLNTALRGQGNANLAMIGILTGGILNIALDPLFIFVFKMGIAGAALATILSQLISFLILLYFNLGKHGTIPLKLSSFKLNFSIICKIIAMGFPSMLRQGLASLAMVVLTRSCTPFGDSALSAISIVSRIMMFMGSAMIGYGQGFQPVCGFNYGAKRYDRVTQAFWFSVKVSAIILLSISTIMFFIAPNVLAAFRKDDLEVIAIGTMALKAQCITLPIQSFFVISNMYLQSTGQSFKASILASARQGIFFLPTAIIFPIIFGINGVYLIQPIADVCCLLLAIYISKGFLKELKTLRTENSLVTAEA